MIDLETFKNSIECGADYHTFLIIVCEDSKFVAEQYVRQIGRNNGCEVVQVDDIKDIVNISNNIFGETSLSVFATDKFHCDDTFLCRVKDTIVVTDKVDKETSKLFGDYIVQIPKLETWQIEDYALSLLEGVSEKDVCSLVSACDNDLYRIENEVAKLKMFTEPSRQFLFNQFTEMGLLPTAEKYTIFSLTNALLTRNVESAKRILNHIDEIDVNPIGLLTILYKNVANVIAIQMNPKATPENTGMASGQFYAIKKGNINYYSSNQLIKIFNFLTSLDLKIKTGEVSMEVVVPYIIEYMLGA